MKLDRIAYLIVGLIILLCASTLALQHSRIFGLAAELIGSEHGLASCIASFAPDKKMDDFDISTAKINNDEIPDAVIRYTNPGYCGSAGCVYELCVSDRAGLYTYVPFSIAAHVLVVSETVTNDVHDIELNNDPHLLFTWDGSRYVLNPNQPQAQDE